MKFKNKEIVFSACDSEYFMEFGIAFINSSLFYGHSTHIHIVNPTQQVQEIIEKLKIDYDLFTFSHHSMDFKEMNEKEIKTYYACMRFLVIPSLFKVDTNIKIMVLDVDTIIKKTLMFPSQDIGLFLREHNEELSFKVAAGIIYITYKNIDFINTVNQIILHYQNTNSMQWYIDQIALYLAYKDKINKEDVYVFTQDYCSWDNNDKAYIWTAKGVKKYKDKLFLKEKEYFENLSINKDI